MAQSVRYSLLILSLCLAGVFGSVASAKPFSASYVDIVQAYNRMLVGRTLVSEEGATIRFGNAGVTSDGRFVVSYAFDLSSGTKSAGFESLRFDSAGVYVDQIIDGVTTRRYFASIEPPFNVFRIRPVNTQTSDFISRECIRRSDLEGTICYIKVRYMDDVIVSQYRERKGLCCK